MKTALFIRSAYLNTPSFDFIERELAEEARRQGVALLSRRNDGFCAADAFLNLPAACLFWDKDVRLACQLEQAGVRLYNRARPIALCDDKTLTYLALKGKVPMPDTLLCPLSYRADSLACGGFAEMAAARFGFPFIIKEGCGSFGEQVYLARSMDEARRRLKQIGPRPALCQAFIAESSGRDVRAYVVGGRVVAAMQRTNLKGDFRANAALGAAAVAYALSKEEEGLCTAAAGLLNLDFAGVDLLFSKDGPLLCEVNSNAHFAALKRVTGVSPAPFIIEALRASL